MAFVCKSERVLKFNPNDASQKQFEEYGNPQLGPGVYMGVKNFSNTKPSVVPFSTSKVREVSEVTNKNPGPGEYKVSVGFEIQNLQANPTVENMMQQLQKNKPAFNSREARFTSKQIGRGNLNESGTIGPGCYDPDQQQIWVKNNKNLKYLRAQSQLRNNTRLLDDLKKNNTSQVLSNSTIMPQLIHHSPPSIPSGDYQFGYKIGEDGYHVQSLKMLDPSQRAKPEELLGPGAYQNIDGIMKIRNNIIPYRTDTSRRTKIELDSSSKILGPGSYDLLKPVMIPSYKNNPNHQSSMFASQTKRNTSIDPLVRDKNKISFQLRKFSHQDGNESRNNNSVLDILSKSHNSSHLYLESVKDQSQIITLKLKNTLENEEEESEIQNEKMEMKEIYKLLDKISPGPGQYISQDLNSSFKKKLKTPQYQFFGSQVKRFQLNKDSDNKIKQNLGPGCYEYDPEQIGKQKLSFKTVGFNTDLQRFYVRDKEIPGPGHYKHQDDGIKAIRDHRSHNRQIQPFGFIEKRFVLRDNKVPGPGEYKPEKSLKALHNKKNEILKGSASFLAQDTERRIGYPVLHHSPPVGSYNPDPMSDIKKTEGTEASNTNSKSLISPRKIQNLSNHHKQDNNRISNKKQTSRFEQSLDLGQREKLSPVRGPGYYENSEQSLMKPKKGKQDNFSASKRFEHGSYFDQTHIKMAPGPGYYQGTDDSLSKNNKSFNLMFS